MAATQSPYRPHNPGHDYYEAGAYLITLVVGERERILSSLNDDAKQPGVVLSQVGRIVHEEWEKTEAIQCGRGRLIETRCQVCMPDHWHGVIIVKERMDKSLGYVIQCFKSACTARWRREVTGYVETASSSTLIRSISVKKRAAYYATRPRIERPLFDDDYDDTICLDERHLRAMVAYVGDNPRRAIIRKLLPQFMQRCLHVMIGGHDYAAFGNLFLLRWPKRVQVFCHRQARLAQLNAEERRALYGDNQNGERWTKEKEYSLKAGAYNQNGENELTARALKNGLPTGACDGEDPAINIITTIPYETTEAFQREHDAWIADILRGATVLVTPGISKGEALMKNECLEHGYPLILLQKEPIGALWKPERKRFDACCNGALLILAPWDIDAMSAVGNVPADTDYARFHNLNQLAKQICAYEGEAHVLNQPIGR